MYKRILVAIDSSTTSERALQEAINLAKDQLATLRIVYAVDAVSIETSQEFIEPTQITDAWAESGRELLAEAKKQALVAGIPVETQLIESEIIKLGLGIADAIVAEAKTWSADLVVIGTHGRTGISHLLFGSVAESIIRICPVPILLIRAE